MASWKCLGGAHWGVPLTEMESKTEQNRNKGLLPKVMGVRE